MVPDSETATPTAEQKLETAARLLAAIGLETSRQSWGTAPGDFFAGFPMKTSEPALGFRVMSAAADIIDFGLRWLEAGGDRLDGDGSARLDAVLARFAACGPPLCSTSISNNLLAMASAGSLRAAVRELAAATAAGPRQPRTQEHASQAPARRPSASGSSPTTADVAPGESVPQSLLDAWLRYLEAVNVQQALMRGVSNKAMAAFREFLRRSSAAEQTTIGADIRSIYDLWIDASETAYEDLLRSPDFAAALGELVNAASALRLDRSVPASPPAPLPAAAAEMRLEPRVGYPPLPAADSSDRQPDNHLATANGAGRRTEFAEASAGTARDSTPDRSEHEPLRALTESVDQVLRKLNRHHRVAIGSQQRERLFRTDGVTLYRYAAYTEQPRNRALLVVYALVNRPYMIDLEKERSLLRGFLHAGLDVYLVDWGYPAPQDRNLTMEDYVLKYLDRCVEKVLEDSNCPTVNLLGICQGGLFALCYSALRPAKVGNLVTMVTPTDFSPRCNSLGRLVRDVDVDQLVTAFGNVPGEMLSALFVSLSPFRLGSQKYLRLVELVDDPVAWASFLRMERWIFDSPDQAGEAFREFLRSFVQENGLIRGKIVIGGERVRLESIDMPVLNIYATRDHIVPERCARALGRYVGTRDYSEYAFRGGHIGVYVSRRAQRDIPGRITRWLLER